MVSPKLFIFDVDGSFRDSSRVLHEGLSTGFVSAGCQYHHNARHAWNIRGIGKYNSRINLVRALYALNLMKRDPNEILAFPDAEKKLDAMIAVSLNDADKSRIEKICKISREFSNSRSAHRLIHVFPYAQGSIDLLKSKGYEVAILTNSSIETVKRDLSQIGLEKFSSIMAKEGLKNKKPSGEGIRKILSITGFRPDETIHIGDSNIDVRAAKNAGCSSAAVLCGMGVRTHLEMEKPDYIFENIWELSKYFSGAGEI